MLIHRLATLTGLAVVTLFMAAPANALTMAECSTKYNTAKDAGTLAGQTWNQFRKAECGTDASATTADTKPAKKTAKATDAAKPDTAKAAATEAAPGLTAKECGTKYQAAKAAGTLNGMKWNDFRKTECAAGASAAADTKPAKTTKAAATATARRRRKGPDGEGMQHQISGCQGRRHAQRHEMERLPQDRMRCRRSAAADTKPAKTDQGGHGRRPPTTRRA